MLLFYVSAQGLPIEPAFGQNIFPGRRKGRHGAIQILHVIEIGIADEVLILRLLPQFRAVQQLQAIPAWRRALKSIYSSSASCDGSR